MTVEWCYICYNSEGPGVPRFAFNPACGAKSRRASPIARDARTLVRPSSGDERPAIVTSPCRPPSRTRRRRRLRPSPGPCRSSGPCPGKPFHPCRRSGPRMHWPRRTSHHRQRQRWTKGPGCEDCGRCRDHQGLVHRHPPGVASVMLALMLFEAPAGTLHRAIVM